MPGMPRRRWMASLLGVVVALSACTPAPVAAPISIEAARAELRGLITDVTEATAYRYRLADDQGRSMGPTEIIWIPEAKRFAAVYFTWDDGDEAFHVQLATSGDLFDWTWEVELADLASQPTIAAASDGGYVVAWEQEPDPIHIVIASFATWNDLRAGAVERRFDVPVTMPACGRGPRRSRPRAARGLSSASITTATVSVTARPRGGLTGPRGRRSPGRSATRR